MGLNKGQTNNPNGRPKGSRNRTTEELRKIFISFLEHNIDEIQSSFDELDAKNKLMFIEKVARLVIPAPLPEIERMPEDQFNLLIRRLKNEN